MKLTEIQQIPPDKARLIDSIMSEVHPGTGAKEGLSWYQGGMRDTGEWYVDKLAALSMERLQEILDKWREQERLGEIQREKDEQLRKEMGDDAYYAMRREEQRQAMIKMSQEIESYLMWGKPIDNQDK